MRKWMAIWLTSLITVAGFTSALMRAQTAQSDAPILSGSDIGFRVEGNKDGSAVGTLMVRINGKWVRAQFGQTMKQLNLK
jgi:hypothetical protein